jgi:IS605 OrfB family transposase
LQAKLPQGGFVSHQLDLLTDKRGRQITAYLHVASRGVVERLVAHRIGTLVIGKNDGWKQAIGLDKRTNQNVVFVPHARFMQILEYNVALVGIRVMVSEELYTSKCSFLDLEPIGKHAVYAGKRVKRGLFRASDGRCLNVDINGAYNILRKGVPNAFGDGIGVSSSPCQDDPGEWASWQHYPCCLELFSGTGEKTQRRHRGDTEGSRLKPVYA